MLLLYICATKMNFLIFTTYAGILFQLVTGVNIIPQKGLYFQQRNAQYLGLDGPGQYTYGYITPTSTKSESKGADGSVRGGYSYLDPKGNLQTIQYIADPIHGFIVAASNLPKDVPSVAYAKQRHLNQYEAIKSEHAALGLSKHSSQDEVFTSHAVSDLSTVDSSSNVPKDVPSVAYAKQRHLDLYEAIKADHAALALSKGNPQPVVIPSNPLKDLPAVVRARAQHLAAFEEVRARDLRLQAARAATDAHSYTPAIPIEYLNQYSYGYTQPGPSTGIHNLDGHGYSYIDRSGDYKSINYIK